MNVQKLIVPPLGWNGVKGYPLKKNTGSSFAELLQEAVHEGNPLTISKHARERLSERNIELSRNDWGRISEKVNEARQKGINESLVLVKNAALIISAKNRTVITAMDRKEAASQIFTNINGAIIIED
mgnify:CR=1 FL=1